MKYLSDRVLLLVVENVQNLKMSKLQETIEKSPPIRVAVKQRGESEVQTDV